MKVCWSTTEETNARAKELSLAMNGGNVSGFLTDIVNKLYIAKQTQINSLPKEAKEL